MKIDRFENIITRKKSKKLALNICTLFSESKDFSFWEQIQKASVSIMNNIAMGFDRKSNKVFKHFMLIAKDSFGEVRSMLILKSKLNKISKKDCFCQHKLAVDISKTMSGLIRHFNNLQILKLKKNFIYF
jgi:four helix bundle protein